MSPACIQPGREDERKGKIEKIFQVVAAPVDCQRYE